MTAFRTVLTIPRAPFEITHSDPLLCIGSCFAGHMAAHLTQSKFRVLLNPTGIVYNPLSVARCLELVLSGRPFESTDLFEQDGLWHSFDHHGSFSDADPDTALLRINTVLFAARQYLESATRVILTLGSAHVFTWLHTGQTVANCHKLPGQQFSRRRLTVAEAVDALVPVIRQLRSCPGKPEIIVTVSPVRYLRDGHVENQRSKATLLLALDALQAQFDFMHYFPAYELVLDDLRDYRFCEADMSHPNELAIRYIWDHFRQVYFDEATRHIADKAERIAAALSHRPLHPGTEAHRRFARIQIEKIEALLREYPGLDFSTEIAAMESVL